MASYIEAIKNNPRLIQCKIVKQSEIYHRKDIRKLAKISSNYVSGELREMKHNIAAEFLSNPKLSGRGMNILRFISFDESAKIISSPSMPFDIKVKIISQCGQSKIKRGLANIINDVENKTNAKILSLFSTVAKIIDSPYMPPDLAAKIIADPLIYDKTRAYILSHIPAFKGARILEYRYINEKTGKRIMRLMPPYKKIEILASPFLSDVKAAKLARINMLNDEKTVEILSNPIMDADRAEKILILSNLPTYRLKNIISKLEENKAIEIIVRSSEEKE